ncbi:hypothetical protein [Kiloniella majae]|uniref:hypothetical protein n=1 Tax=Kiloniella majae TaxID=1938558 RepID=UPI000A279560|nr:hypothetical protein [Kiloniella majae]
MNWQLYLSIGSLVIALLAFGVSCYSAWYTRKSHNRKVAQEEWPVISVKNMDGRHAVSKITVSNPHGWAFKILKIEPLMPLPMNLSHDLGYGQSLNKKNGEMLYAVHQSMGDPNGCSLSLTPNTLEKFGNDCEFEILIHALFLSNQVHKKYRNYKSKEATIGIHIHSTKTQETKIFQLSVPFQ